VSGLVRTVRAEWTKFRTVRGWMIGLLAAAGLTVGLGLLPGLQGSCGKQGPGSECRAPVGPDGVEVTDSFSFVNRPLTGDGSLTARVTSLTGRIPTTPDPSLPDGPMTTRAGLAPWAKAGLIIKATTRPGSAYAAVMATGDRGTRMQHNYLYDVAGSPGSVATTGPRWLRLTRAGDTITAAESRDGLQWTEVGAITLPDLPDTVYAGLFVTSPQHAEAISGTLGVSGAAGGPTEATATFDRVTVSGGGPNAPWASTVIGESGSRSAAEAIESNAEGFRVTGSGDIAPAVAGAAGAGTTVTQTLVGTFGGLIVVVALGVVFITTEYRRGLFRTTLSANPRRGQVLAAKSIVIGGASFVAGVVGAAVVVVLGQQLLKANGVYVLPATIGTQLRLIVGTGALLAVAAVLAVGLGVLVRRSAAAVMIAVVFIVFPYLLAMSVLPAGAGGWLLRVAPAAAFAVQQSTPAYPQVANLYTPASGYFPLAPWAGFAVLCGWATLALVVAALVVRRRDA